MKRFTLIFLAILITSCSTASAQPEQAAVDKMISIYNGGNGSEKGWEKQTISDFVELRLSNADTANGIEQRVCITLSYIEKNDQGVWEDQSISYAMEKKDGQWQEDAWLTEQRRTPLSPQYLDALVKIISGNCDWAREFYGVPG